MSDTTGTYGYDQGQVQQVKTSFETNASQFRSIVTEVGNATNSTAAIWDSPAYATYKVKLDNYADNAEALERCVNAFDQWLDGFVTSVNAVDDAAAETWSGFSN